MSAAVEPAHTLADLEAWSFPGTALAVVGRPVAHSLSPAIHNAALAELSKGDPRFTDWRYFKFDIAPEDLPRALGLFQQHRFHGLNLTVPHKSVVVPHLSAADSFVRAAGAANTLSRVPAGWRGANTDGYGLTTALKEQLGVELPGANLILLGAGGAARGAAVECLRAGVASLAIGNRTVASLDQLLADLRPLAGRARLRGFSLTHPPADLPKGAVVVNATSLGLAPGDAAPVDLRQLPAPGGIYDMIYRPAQTALLRDAAALGLPHANGLSMLIHQGARSLEIWTDAKVPVATMQAAAHAALASP